MSNKTRYLQLNDVMMLEYIMKTNGNDSRNNEKLYFTKLLDNHYCVFSPNDCELAFNNDGTKRVVTPDPEASCDPRPIYNTMNHLAIPMDRKCNDWYTFIDNNYDYAERDELSSEKAKQYKRYMQSPSEGGDVIQVLPVNAPLGYDEIRLYLVNGYDFSDMFGILCRVYVDTDFIGSAKKLNPPYIDLCNFFFTKGTGYKMVEWLPEPIIFGNNVYDKYISIDIPSLHDICINTDNPNVGTPDINSYLHIKENAPVHIEMTSVESNDYDISKIEPKTKRDLVFGTDSSILNDLVNCEFVRTSTLHGAIPTETLTSDRLGVYISLNNEFKCLEYCCTWQDNYGTPKPIDYDTVSLFNNSITLYDRSLIREHSPYEIDDDYDVDQSLSIRNWVALHEIVISYNIPDPDKPGKQITLKREKYSMTQTFWERGEDTLFFYRPFIKDLTLLDDIERLSGAVVIDYSVRFMNTRDMVQFLNTASLTIDPLDLKSYYINSVYIADGTNSDFMSKLAPYNVYNKIIESKHEISKNWTPVNKIKYVKVFYDSTDVVLEGSNGTYYASNNIEITLSPVPKNYKFVIKNRKQDNVYDYMDLSDGYYKLYAKDSNNNDIIIEPTYSSNMNLLLGELEFSINLETLNTLMNVDESMRRMSIVAYNTDNSISSLFDFTYTF